MIRVVPRSVRIAVVESARHPLRTLLVSQGMIWAVALAICPAAIIEGSKSEALERARQHGTDIIEVRTADGAQLPRSAYLTTADLSDVDDALAAGSAPADDPAIRAAFRVRSAGSPFGTVWLVASEFSAFDLRRVHAIDGELPRLVLNRDRRQPTAVAIEETLAAKMLPGGLAPGSDQAGRPLTSLVGSRWLLETPVERDGAFRLTGFEPAMQTQVDRSSRFRILEVAAVVSDHSRGNIDRFGYERDAALGDLVGDLLRMVGIESATPPWQDSGLGIYLPLQAIPSLRVDWLMLRTAPLDVEPCATRVDTALTAKGRQVLVASNAVLPILTNPEIEGYLRLHQVLYVVFVTIGLAVLCNLLLLAGWRRRREIALRRAEGATRSDVFMQFVWEGVVIAVLGYVGGVLAGLGIAMVRVWLDPNVAFAVTIPWAETVRAGLWLTIGAVLASSWPAWRATRHDPMLLLRRNG